MTHPLRRKKTKKIPKQRPEVPPGAGYHFSTWDLKKFSLSSKFLFALCLQYFIRVFVSTPPFLFFPFLLPVFLLLQVTPYITRL